LGRRDSPVPNSVDTTGAWIGVGTAHLTAPPLPPNRTCGSPAYGSPVDEAPEGTGAHGTWRLPTRSTRNRCAGRPAHPAPRGLRHPSGKHGTFARRHQHFSSRGSGNMCHHACFLSGFVFLPPLAPPELPGFFATMAALTAARPGSPVVASGSSPCLTSHRLPTIPPLTTWTRRVVAFRSTSWSARHACNSGPMRKCPVGPVRPKAPGGGINCCSGLRHTLASSSHVPAKSSSSPADWLFAFRCSQPRLAATQLQSATYWMRWYGVDLHHSDDVRSQAHERRSPDRHLPPGAGCQAWRGPPSLPLAVCRVRQRIG